MLATSYWTTDEGTARRLDTMTADALAELQKHRCFTYSETGLPEGTGTMIMALSDGRLADIALGDQSRRDASNTTVRFGYFGRPLGVKRYGELVRVLKRARTYRTNFLRVLLPAGIRASGGRDQSDVADGARPFGVPRQPALFRGYAVGGRRRVLLRSRILRCPASPRKRRSSARPRSSRVTRRLSASSIVMCPAPAAWSISWNRRWRQRLANRRRYGASASAERKRRWRRCANWHVHAGSSPWPLTIDMGKHRD
jgi:hypothetical protein